MCTMQKVAQNWQILKIIFLHFLTLALELYFPYTLGSRNWYIPITRLLHYWYKGGIAMHTLLLVQLGLIIHTRGGLNIIIYKKSCYPYKLKIWITNQAEGGLVTGTCTINETLGYMSTAISEI